jgi:hypothetical protein
VTQKIFPRNLTARAAVSIAGNPVTTRLESGVGNCFPGLEFDHRNLDRRFFPGLVFNFGVIPPVLAAVDGADPALAETTHEDDAELSAAVRTAFEPLGTGEWRMSAISQGDRRLDLQALAATPVPDQPDPALFWRIVRSLTPGKTTIVLTQVPTPPTASASPAAAPLPATLTLTHYRRQFVGVDDGVISTAYPPGELTQSLCSPWMHDFRDCACDYWASNHPDIALGADDALSANAPTVGNPDLAVRPLDWLRADRESRVAASISAVTNDRYRLRHYQINSEWGSLAFVIEGRENQGIYTPGFEHAAEPFANPADLADELVRLCGLEHVVMLEYLYAYYSLRAVKGTDQADTDLLFVRHELLGIAVSEMRHLRWANQLLWTLGQMGRVRPYPPALTPGLKVPGRNGERDRALRPLTQEVLDDFIAVERPSGTLDGQYARVVATLRHDYPEPMLQLARQIVADGMDHFNRFREISVVLQPWAPADGKPAPWLRPVTPGNRNSAAQALALYQSILDNLAIAYRHGDMEDAGAILAGRQNMMAFDAEAEKLAESGTGVPFF